MGTYLFKMPDIGEGIVEAEVVAWHVSVGDEVAEDAAVADVMTDKATVEITSPVAGKIRSLGCAAGEKMVIGSPFVEFEVEGAGQEVGKQENPDPPATDTPEKVVPASSHAAQDNSANVADTGAVTVNLPSLPSSKPKIRVVSDGEVLKPAAVTEITKSAPQPRRATTSKAGKDDSNSNTSESRPKVVDISPHREIVAASPAVRRLARDLGIDLASVRGTGPAGRVVKEDIRALLMSPPGGGVTVPADKSPTVAHTPEKSVAEPPAATVSADSADGDDLVTDVPVIGLRRLIAERMQTAKQRIPHFSYVEEVCVDQLEELRQVMNANREEHQAKLSVLHFVLMAVAREVTNWPQCNAQFDDDNSVLRHHSRVHLGVATMTDSGLMVPVVTDACQRDIWDMADEVNRLAEDARSGNLSREELSGSTITVTSLGSLAGITTTPVINRPETSIVGPNKIMQKVVWKSGAAVPVSVMNLSSSFDHRVVDGYDAACFIQAVKKLLENPALLFI